MYDTEIQRHLLRELTEPSQALQTGIHMEVVIFSRRSKLDDDF